MRGWITGLGLVVLGCAGAAAQAPSADYNKFKHMSDGRWMSTIEAKIGNPKSFLLLQPGLPIERNATVVGVNISDALDRLCGGTPE